MLVSLAVAENGKARLDHCLLRLSASAWFDRPMYPRILECLVRSKLIPRFCVLFSFFSSTFNVVPDNSGVKVINPGDLAYAFCA
jgi:hypothetical protein